MKPTLENSIGTISISNGVIAGICEVALKDCYGVVGVATSNIKDSIKTYMSGGGKKKGVNISTEADGMIIEMYIVVKYGVNLHTVAQSVMSTVKYKVEEFTDYKVKKVSVNIVGILLDEGGSVVETD
ncbi:MAG: Asp23/Gls24 family envelope stress response protein [Eubacteriales bacterium]|nr:Asp23/Gls24 family envelope stress response protein [Eubacteriales bacterium]